MKFNLSRRTKLIGGIIIGIMLVLSGTVFALGETGVINIKSLADELASVITPASTSQTILNVSLTLPENVPSGATIQIKNTSTNSIYTKTVTDPGNNIFTGNYTFTGIDPGNYTSDESKCVRVYPFSVTANTTNSARGEILSNCSTTGQTCGSQTCAPTQHCNSQTNNCENNQSGTYSIYGYVKSTSGGTLGGVEINTKVITEWSGPNMGRYTYDELSASSQSSQTFTYTKLGYKTKTLRLSELGISRTVLNGENLPANPVILEPDGNSEFDDNTFSLIGAAKDRNGDLMPDVTVRVTCNASDQSPGVSCGSSTNWSATSKAELQTYYPNFANRDDKAFNYEVTGINRFPNYTVFPKLKIEFSRQGYFWDKNGDGLDNDSNASFIEKPSVYTSAPNKQSYMSWKNAVMVANPAPSDKFTLLGRVTDEGGNRIEGVRVKASCTNCGVPNEWTTFTSKQDITIYPSIIRGYNYFIPNLKKTYNGSEIPKYRVEYSKVGFQTESIDLNQNEIFLEKLNPDGTTAWAGWGDKVLKREEGHKLKIFGRVFFEDPASGDTIPLSDRLVKLGNCGTAQDTTSTGTFDKSFAEKSGNFAFPEIVTSESQCNNPNITLDLRSRDEYAIPILDRIKNLDDASYNTTIENTTFVYYEFKVLLNLQANFDGDKFTIFGEASDTNDTLIKDVYIETTVSNSNYKRGKHSSEKNEWPETGDKTANYFQDYVPLIPGYNYQMKVTAPANYGFVDPGADTSSGITNEMIKDTIVFSFSYSQVYFNEYYQKYLYNQDIKLIRKNTPNITLGFRDAQTGEWVEIEEENILKNSISCNTENFPPNQVIGHISDYKVSYTCQVNKISLDFETDNYTIMHINDIDKLLVNFSYTDVYLVKKNKFEDSLACRTFSGIQFCTYKFAEKEIFTSTRNTIIAKYAKVFLSILSLTKTKQPPYVFITPSQNESDTGDFLNQSEDSPLFVNLVRLNQADYGNWVDDLFHEIGHYTWFKNGNQNDGDLSSIFESFSQTPGNSKPTCSAALFPTYPCFSPSANISKEDFWAEYFKYWVFNSDKIDKINDDTILSKEEYKECKTALIRMDLLMKNKFPGIIRFKPVSRGTSRASSTIPSAQAESINTAQTISTTEEDIAFFTNAMLSIGYAEYTPTTVYSTIAPLSELTLLTPTQMAQGVWLTENFNQLPVAQRYQIKIKQYTARAQNFTAQAVGTVNGALNNINNKIEELLIKLGVRITATEISGKIIDQSSIAVKGWAVTISSKTDQTDKSGEFDIRRTKSGDLTVEVKNQKTGKIYTATPRKVTISDNQKLTGLIFQINRPRRTISGQILNKNNSVLANGKIKVSNEDGEQTFNLDKNGKFNFQLKEGVCKFKIYDSNDHGREVSSPGSFLNLNQVKITGNMDGVITLKY